MSILIKGMEMPKKIEPGLVIEFADGIDGTRYARLHHYQYGGLTGWFEAVPVPPHGRLIDADALKVSLVFAEKTAKWAVPALRAVLMIIDEMPTIIPAEEATRKDGGQDA